MEPFRTSPLLVAKRRRGGRRSRQVYAASVGIHVVAFGALFAFLPTRPPEEEERWTPIDVVFYSTLPEEPPPLPPPLPPEPKLKPKEKPPKIEPVKPPPTPAPPEPIAQPVVVERVAPPAPPVVEPPARTAPKPEPKPEVRTDVFATTRLTPKSPAPARVARVGEFGEALTDNPQPRRDRGAVAQVGGFEVQEEARPAGAPRPGAVARAGFADGVGEAEARPATRSGTVATAGFDRTALEAGKPRPRARAAAATFETGVEIVAKPKPVYTDEARRLRVEGEVVLEVTFVASGRLRVLRVVSPLGHGLDEAAIAAAEKIQFTPARRNGVAVDHTATLRVVFRLA